MKKKIIAALFLCSGASGLIYETLWIRVLSLGVGSTSQSMSLVLSLFFLGLSLGSYLSGQRASLVQSPLRLYAFIEIFLGASALLLIFPLLHLHSLMSLLPLSGSFSWLGQILKFFIVGSLLLVPTLCMGATLPLLIQVFSKAHGSVEKNIAKLYALNTLGAVVGAFGTGYWLIPRFGVLGSNYVAVGINLAVGIIALKLATKVAAPDRVKLEKPQAFALEKYWVIGITFLCGFVSIAFEVIWNKYLNIFFGTNLYGLGLVLALFLFGIALGSFLLSLFVDKIKNKERTLSVLFGVTLLALLFSTVSLNEAPRLSLLFYFVFKGVLSLLLVKTLIISALLFLPTCLFGALFPLCVSILENKRESAARAVGLAYTFNTVGAILGSYLAGMILIPSFGSSNTIQILIAAMAVGLVVIALRVYKTWPTHVAFACLGVGTLYFAHHSVRYDFKDLIKSAYQQKIAAQASKDLMGGELASLFKPFEKDYEDFKAVYEGETAIITLSHDPADGENYKSYLRLKTSGLNESIYNLSDLEELPKYEALVGFLPYLFSRAPKEAFVVGYGGGYTVDLLTQTSLKKVNVVELEKGILKAADYVYNGNNPILSRKNLNLQVEDARFVLTTKQLPLQDIIVSQPSHSWLPGASNLFTKEFFEIVKENLSERGIFSQWLNLYNMDVEVLRSILKTFFSVFPEGAVFTELQDQELVLVGSVSPLELNLKKLEAIQKNPIFKKKLALIFKESPLEILSLYSLARQDALILTEGARLNTDRNAFAEVRQARIFYEGQKGETPQQYLSRAFSGDYSPILKGKDSPQFYYDLLLSLSSESEYEKYYAVLNQFEKKRGTTLKKDWNLGYLTFKAKRYYSAEKYLRQAFNEKPSQEVFILLLSSLMEMERYSEVLSLLGKFPQLKNEQSDCHEIAARSELGKLTGTKALEEKMARNITGYTQSCGTYFNKVFGAHFLETGKPAIAIPFLEAYYSVFGDDVSNLYRMIRAYRLINDEGNERQFREYLPVAIENERRRLQKLIDLHRGKDQHEDAEVLSRLAARLSRPIDHLSE